MLSSTWMKVSLRRRACGIGTALLFLWSGFSVAGPVAAQDHPPEAAPSGPQAAKIHHDLNLADVAWEYLEALLNEHFDQAATFLTSESRYQDFSMEFFGRDMVDLKGAKAITEFWRASSEASGVIEVRFDADQFFVAGPNVYFIGTAWVKNEGKAWGVNMESMEFTFTQISHIRMVDGKVTYHADHVDYSEAFAQLETYREEAGAWVPEGKEKP